MGPREPDWKRGRHRRGRRQYTRHASTPESVTHRQRERERERERGSAEAEAEAEAAEGEAEGDRSSELPLWWLPIIETPHPRPRLLLRSVRGPFVGIRKGGSGVCHRHGRSTG